MKAALIVLFALASAAHAAPAAPAAPAASDYGILLLAHGGEPEWNAEVAKLRDTVDQKVPTETALGMADPKTLQAGLDALAKRGVKRVVAVPLFVQSRSEVMDQTKYALGLSTSPSSVLREAAERMAAMHPGMPMHHHMFSLDQVKSPVPVALAAALDDDVIVSRILLQRAKGLSADPKKETVVLVAHGPVDDAAVSAWNESLMRHAEFVRREGGFRAATFAILRDDAAPPVRAASVADLRAKTAGGAKNGGALVVPVLIARGGIEGKLASDLKGLDYKWDGQTLMPHVGFDDWILKRARGLTGR